MLFVLLLVVVAVGMVGCGRAPEAARLSIGWSESPQAGLNPFLARNEGDYLFLGLIYEPLLMPLMDGTVKPWLARAWEFDEQGNAWIFHLDERARWSDGERLTAEDVKFSFETAYENNFPLGSLTRDFVESVLAVDEHTVRFEMRQPFAAFLPTAGATLIMPEHIWSEVERVDLHQNENPVGSGPFVLSEFRPRAFMHVVKNENYWQGPPAIDEVVIRVFLNQEAEVAAFKKGELDVLPDLSGSESLIPALQGDENIHIAIDRWPHVLYVAPNHRIYPLGMKEFRRAIDIALDKRAILETALAGYGEPPLMGYVPPLVTKWVNTKLQWRGMAMSEEARLREASSILDGLGFVRGEDGVRRTDEGEPLEFTVSCITYPSYIRTAEMVKQNLEAIGLRLTVQVSDPETLYGGIVFSGKRPTDWDLLVHGTTVSPDPDHFAREYAPDPPNPWDNAVALGWENAELQSLLRESRREMNEDRRWEMVQRAQELFADELVVITLGHRSHAAAHRLDRFKGWNPEPVNYGGMMHPLGSIVNILSLEPN